MSSTTPHWQPLYSRVRREEGDVEPLLPDVLELDGEDEGQGDEAQEGAEDEEEGLGLGPPHHALEAVGRWGVGWWGGKGIGRCAVVCGLVGCGFFGGGGEGGRAVSSPQIEQAIKKSIESIQSIPPKYTTPHNPPKIHHLKHSRDRPRSHSSQQPHQKNQTQKLT